jgi:predicted AAA+ superfamily ATPase
MFGAVLVTGARQVGKTTLVDEFVGDKAGRVTLDDKLQLASAVGQSGTFFKDNPPPVFVDEVQHAPGLFPQIKVILDRERKKGLFYLSGSQQFNMMIGVTESLAGRIGILSLSGLSVRELCGVKCKLPFLPTEEYFAERGKDGQALSYDGVWQAIHRGSFPELCANPGFDWQMFYGAYVRTYLERDVRSLAQVGDEIKFLRFMSMAAGLTGQLLNMSSLARDAGVSQPTAERWLSILQASGLAFLLQPYYGSFAKRMVKTPKLYFMDTGLAAYLTRWNTAEALKMGAMAGHFFETFVVSEIAKSYANKGVLSLPLYFWRDRDGNEIDLLIEDEGALYPIEIKKHADPEKSDVAKFSLLDKVSGAKRGSGGVVCMYDSLVTLGGNDKAIPVSFL